MDGYEYHVFLSYRRVPNVAGWVQRHFAEVLKNCLADEIPDEPKIFLDVQAIETGAIWPDRLESGLRHSRLMVAVLSPPYFRSKWCTAEWTSMARREEMLSLQGQLIYPVVFSDGDTFHEHVQARKLRSVKEWAYPFPQYAESQEYLGFYDMVRGVAAELARWLADIPAWRPDWPIERPDAVSGPRRAVLPEL